MNQFQRILLAPAAIGLMVPAVAIEATAGELASLNGREAISDYMEQQEVDELKAWRSLNQVTSVNQFSDVRPTDWAYQALTNLVEKYGCVAGYPNGTYKGGQAMTRFEAAALLNACLDRVTEVTDELQRLMDEFKKELAVLKGRVDGLEAKVGTLEAQQFSTTTRLRGETSFIIGGLPNNDVDGDNKTAFNYDLRLSFDTSYTGKDLLRTRLRAGNFTGLPFSSGSQIFQLDKATGSDGSDNVKIDRLFYTFPVGDQVKLTAGALVRNTELLSFRPSAYKSDILDYFGLSGASGTYNKATGAGFGFQWKQKVEKGKPFVTFDTSYIAQNKFSDSSVGAFESASGINWTNQLGIKGQNWGVAAGYRYGTAESSIRNPNFSPSRPTGSQSTNSVSIAGYWEPTESGWIPSISLGYGYNAGSGGFDDSQSWMAGLQWNDVFQKGNSAGFAVGQPPFNSGNDSESWLWEVFYKYQVTDNISITPAIFYASDYAQNNSDSTWGGVIQTTFRF